MYTYQSDKCFIFMKSPSDDVDDDDAMNYANLNPAKNQPDPIAHQVTFDCEPFVVTDRRPLPISSDRLATVDQCHR